MGLSRKMVTTGLLPVLCVGLALSLAACGGSSSAGSTGASGSSSSGTSAADAPSSPAEAAVGQAKAAGAQPPDSSSRPAVSGKKVAIIVLSLDESGSTPAKAAQAAASVIGWQSKVFNANHSVPAVTTLARQAISGGYDAIIPIDIDCDFAAKAFAQAKAQHIVIVPINGFDCNDPLSPAKGPSAFSAEIKTAFPSYDAFWEQPGIDAANEIIADSGDKAKIISVENPELGALLGMQKGFRKTIAKSKGSKIVDTVTFTTPDYISGKVTQMVRAALAKHPDATYIKSPFTSTTAQYIVPGVASAHSSAKVVGGEGLASELGLIRAGKVLSTTTIPAAWEAWAAIDTINSVFRHESPANSNVPWVLVDRSNVPGGGTYVAKADYQSAYRKAWGK